MGKNKIIFRVDPACTSRFDLRLCDDDINLRPGADLQTLFCEPQTLLRATETAIAGVERLFGRSHVVLSFRNIAADSLQVLLKLNPLRFDLNLLLLNERLILETVEDRHRETKTSADVVHRMQLRKIAVLSCATNGSSGIE